MGACVGASRAHGGLGYRVFAARGFRLGTGWGVQRPAVEPRMSAAVGRLARTFEGSALRSAPPRGVGRPGRWMMAGGGGV